MNARAKLLIAALAALGAVSQYAQAEALPYKDIKLCDGVTLKSDSAKQWGCWTKFAPPAAGPSAVGYLANPTSQPYLPPVNPTQQTTSSCAAGSMCGYAVYLNTKGWVAADTYSPATFSETINSGTVGFSMSPTSSDPAPAYSYPGLLPIMSQTTTSFVAYGGTGSLFAYIDGTSYQGNQQITTGNGVINGDTPGTGVKGIYVVGTPTDAASLANLVTSNISASYSGVELVSGNAVNINVNFGSANWNGTWGSGATAWHASGSVSGGNIQSVGNPTGLYTAGSVQGTFYGTGASALGGAVNVSNSTTSHVDVFATVKN